ncbi:hypothetical protein LXL04_027193 [Taraxacum kok-saghyz]
MTKGLSFMKSSSASSKFAEYSMGSSSSSQSLHSRASDNKPSPDDQFHQSHRFLIPSEAENISNQSEVIKTLITDLAVQMRTIIGFKNWGTNLEVFFNGKMKGDEPQKDESIDGVVKIDVAVRVDEAAIRMEIGFFRCTADSFVSLTYLDFGIRVREKGQDEFQQPLFDYTDGFKSSMIDIRYGLLCRFRQCSDAKFGVDVGKLG